MTYRKETKEIQISIDVVPEGWKVLEMSSICDISSSKRIFMKEYAKGGIPFYRSKEIIMKSNKQNINNPLFISNEKYENVKMKFGVPKSGDILLTSVGTLGIPYIINDNEKFYFKDGNLTWFKDFNNEIYNLFIYYWFKSNIAQETISAIAIGTTQRALTINSLKKIKVLLPPLQEQKTIASILKSLDDKIELNNQINHTLEQIAQSIFKNWFIDFEFPNGQSLPYKSSGGEMVESELGKIPKGWKSGLFKDLIFEKTERIKQNNGINVLSVVHSGNIVLSDDFFNKQVYSKNISNYKKIKPNEFAFNPARINIGSIGMNEFDFAGAISPIYVVFKVINDFEHFFKLILNTNKIKNIIKQLCSGTVRQTITFETFSNVKIIIPPIELIHKFNNFYIKFNKFIKDNDNQSDCLSQIRDTLLPKLMTGKIRVNPDE